MYLVTCFRPQVKTKFINKKIVQMNKVSFSKNKASLCYKNACINTTGDIAKVITYSVAFMVVVSSIASLLNATNK